MFRLSVYALSLAFFAEACFLAHSFDTGSDEVEPVDGGGRADGPSGEDAGPPPVVPVPGGRPSDDPGADEWEDPPREPPEDVCCELGEPIEVTLPDEQGGQLAVAWHGDGWAVVVAGDELTTLGGVARYVSLDPEVTHVVSRALLGAPGTPSDLRPIGDEIGVALYPWAGRGELYFGTIDRRGVSSVDFRALPGGPMARLAHQRIGDRWAVATLESEEDLIVHALDGSGDTFRTDDLGGRPQRSTGSWVVEGLGSRVVVAWVEDGSLRAQNLDVNAGPIGPVIDAGGAIVGSDGAIAATTFRDSVVVSNLRRREAWLTFYNPFEGTTLQRVIGEATVSDRAIELAGSAKTGLIGVCIPTGSGGFGGGGGGNDGVDFQLVSPDGTTYGERVPIIGGLQNIGGCAVGAQGRTFVVVWWRASGGPEYNSLWARRVSPRL